ncbi:host specificity protein [Rhodobacteraceae bacterium CCMM004]|nr:host specificity protein [Rhodobacteraceae bacterium CCMM004]
MATIVLSAVGSAIGASLGGSVLGLSSVVIGRAVGATLGRVIDQSLLGQGSQAVETGRVDRFRLTGAGEGSPVAHVHGRVRVGGQVIWASDFLETATTTGGGGGKGAPKQPTVTEYSYSVSLAVGLCEGVVGRIGRVWADGDEIARDSLDLRLYPGTEDQLPDPKIEAVEGAGAVPAFRGLAYVVIEDLDLGRFGNRVPQFSFEVTRPEPADLEGSGAVDLARGVRAVAMMPGTGEYALATTPVHFEKEPGVATSANVNTPLGKTDFAVSLEALTEEAPNCEAVSLIVAWFGDDLRAGACRVQPMVEQKTDDGVGMPWTVSGIDRAGAAALSAPNGRPIYGGTPADRSVREAIQAMAAAGQAVTFYPFLLMTQAEDNTLIDPYTGAEGQPKLPWRGRITTALAPGVDGTTDRTAAAEAEVAAFFGQAGPGDFDTGEQGVSYTGPADGGYRRFILHYAHLCAQAGGVEAFCIGSEMRGLTQIRGANGSFPAVAAFRQLAADVRQILGPTVQIGYAADWSEYFGYHPQDGSGDVLFHLDPLWADPNVDFIGIDNYMPMADWRDGFDHADADYGAIYNLDYLKANIAGGEGFDWYYHAPEAEAVQRRTPITDGAYGEPWVFRYKDLVSWWSNPHHDRPGGVRSDTPTDWVPMSKPIRFTEIGCAAIDKGANQPNRFLDPKSSESGVPRYSSGRRDDLMQMQFLRAVFDHWGDPANNPVSEVYSGPMVDPGRIHVWAWDARPYPFFPGRTDLWDDHDNYARGHWITGRITARALASVVREICGRSAIVEEVDADRLYDVVRGYVVGTGGDARSALQPLMLAYGFDVVERAGRLIFATRDGRRAGTVDPARLAVSGELDGDLRTLRSPEAERVGRLRLTYTAADGDFETRVAEAVFPDERSFAAAQSDLPLVLTPTEGAAITERWLAEARVARDRVSFALPPSAMAWGAGDAVEVAGGLYRIDHVAASDHQVIEATRIERELYTPSDTVEAAVRLRRFVAPVPVLPVFLDLPLLTGDEVPHAPRLAVSARPWPGSVALYDAPLDAGYQLNTLVGAPATIGVTETVLAAARPGLFDRGPALRVRLISGTLASVGPEQLFAGANAMAIGQGTDDVWEVFQFLTATLVLPDTYDLSLRLRGQAGTDALMPSAWPPGSRVVLLDPRVVQIDLAAGQRGLARYYRAGPAGRPVDDPVYVQTARAFDGVGLRPYSPAHLRAMPAPGGDLELTWIRRTRIDGDTWQSVEVPLGEAEEQYEVRVRTGGQVLRTATVAVPQWTYTAADRVADGAQAPFTVEVAQVSDRFGPGPFAATTVTV